MPNWITNNVRIIADESLLAKIRKEVRGTPYSNGDDKDFDFNQIAPIPKELEGTTSPTRIISQKEYDKQEERILKGELTDSEKDFGVSRGLTQKLVNEYKQRFGHSDWYSWQNENWGTKWNAKSVYWSDDNDFVNFETAWSTPFNLFTKLSEKYPDAIFEIQYADEDFGHNVGLYTLKGGFEIDCNVPEGGSREAIELAMMIHYGGAYDYDFDSEFEDIYDDKLNSYIKTMIDIAYDNDVEPFEDCDWHELVLERFKEKALSDENFELVIMIQKELDKVEK